VGKRRKRGSQREERKRISVQFFTHDPFYRQSWRVYREGGGKRTVASKGREKIDPATYHFLSYRLAGDGAKKGRKEGRRPLSEGGRGWGGKKERSLLFLSGFKEGRERKKRGSIKGKKRGKDRICHVSWGVDQRKEKKKKGKLSKKRNTALSLLLLLGGLEEGEKGEGNRGREREKRGNAADSFYPCLGGKKEDQKKKREDGNDVVSARLSDGVRKFDREGKGKKKKE